MQRESEFSRVSFSPGRCKGHCDQVQSAELEASLTGTEEVSAVGVHSVTFYLEASLRDDDLL